jgi:hypothetical protein
MISPVLFFWFPEMYTTPLLAVLGCFLQSNIRNVVFYSCCVFILQLIFKMIAGPGNVVTKDSLQKFYRDFIGIKVYRS